MGAYLEPSAVKACNEAGLTAQQTAEHLGVAKATVWRKSSRAGIQAWPRQPPHPRRDEIAAALADGAVTARTIAAHTGQSHQNVLQGLYAMEDIGMVRRAGTAARFAPGRAPIIWHVVVAA